MPNEPEDDAERYDDWPLGEHPPPPCPTCGRESTPIVYGMPGLGLAELAERGAVILGGCVIDDGQPTHRCRAGHEWAAQPPR